ncbi:(E)-4-hydroxy-3-methylbut-2-enyl-diphosphate synthase [candidate division KSB1 bacterium]|nr:(E)-4-hydroxy-3-methylbut-2-enyl-diphosphate synthase [candidate division KSB1 bacterium]
MKYCESIFAYKRRPTHEVMIGDIGIGGSNPIRIQSMTTADTMDTEATVAEALQLAQAGCEIVRITAPSIKDAHNLAMIKQQLHTKGCKVPLVADIHFTPNAALIAAEIVEKVRINPGNYADKKKFEVREYSDSEYDAELSRIADRFSPLVELCKKNGTAMRIGVNHGSLSDRVMNRFGDTPEGMVESALEFLHICENLSYRDVVISMKASNPLVMIQAYRLLANKMYELGMTYPFHLGVTEAGDGEDGRIKSAVGIGTLLEDGLGDTIRVSLTEDAVYEIPVAAALVEKYNTQHPQILASTELEEKDFHSYFNPFQAHKLHTQLLEAQPLGIGKDEPVRVVISSDGPGSRDYSQLLKADTKPEWLIGNGAPVNTTLKDGMTYVAEDATVHPIEIELGQSSEFENQIALLEEKSNSTIFLKIDGFSPQNFSLENAKKLSKLLPSCKAVLALIVPSNQIGALTAIRQFLLLLRQNEVNLPIVLSYRIEPGQKNWQLDAASVLGALLTTGIGDGLMVHGNVTAQEAIRFSYNLLQATRLRITKTEYISCPSCGRTLFNLQSTTERIKTRTTHLKGVKIAIMGCIVNGPGEMADADFGYVGSGRGMIDLFVGKERVQRNIPQAEADSRLIDLIKEHGMWVEPEE